MTVPSRPPRSPRRGLARLDRAGPALTLTRSRPIPDLPTIRRACQPIARWWDHYLATGRADPDRLDQALVDARALGPLSGRLGEALAYIIAGCLPDLNYADAAAAFDRIAAVGRGASLDVVDSIRPQPPPAAADAAAAITRGEQLAFPGITTAPLTPGRNQGTGRS